MKIFKWAGLSFLLVIVHIQGVYAFQEETQKVSGTITDMYGASLPFANVTVKNTKIGTVSSDNGHFSLNLKTGEHIIVISYIGYQEKEVLVTIGSMAITVTIELQENLSELEGAVVYGQIARGQAKAFNEQQKSVNIVNVVDIEQFSKFPDVSAAEIVQRLPSISITRDQGEGEFVQIRGIPEQFNSLTLNGQRMPSMEPDAERAVGLDLVQSFLIEKITVSKALTADMDADAIGGSVNFELREANKSQSLEATVGYGINQQESEFRTYGRDIATISLLGSKRFFNNKFGALLASNYYNSDKGSMFNARGFTDINANTIRIKRATDYDIIRERFGVIGNFDYRFNDFNKLVLTTNFNGYRDNEIRRQARYTWDNQRQELRTRNRLEEQKLYFGMLKGTHEIGIAGLDYAFSYSKGSEELPDRTEFRYRRTEPALANLDRDEQERLSANSTFGDPTPLTFNRADFSPRFTEETNTTTAINLSIPLGPNAKSTLKTGIKYRSLKRNYKENGFRLSLGDNPNVMDVNEGEFPYPDLRFTDSAFASLGFNEAPSDFTDADLEGYTASEDIFAAYIMDETNFSNTFSGVFGLRLESTSTNYVNKDNGLSGEGSYVNIMPSAHLTYKFNKENQLRFAYSTGLSRPAYSALVPFESIGDEEINRGNADLEPITANNFDLMFERYTSNLGFIGLGVFAKYIDNQIITEQITVEGGMPVFMPINGASARVFGFEASVSQSLKNLKVPITINANYTLTDSKADFGDNRDELPLANSPKHIANLSFIYDNPKSGFTAVLGGVYRHFMFNKFEDNNDANPGNENVWLDRTFHLDASFGYQFNEQWTIKLQLNNLTNESNTEVSGKPSDANARWTETESYGMWALLSLEFKL